MRGETQEAFVDRVREALRDRGEPVPLPDDFGVSRVIGPEADVVRVFCERVEQTGMFAHRVADEAALAEKVAELAAEAGATSAVIPSEEIPAREQIVAQLRARGVEMLDPDAPDSSFEADMGITGVSLAVAETASMAVISGGPRRRLASLAVPVHIAVLRAGQILPDLLDWASQAPADPPACEVLISGPSKTADIEMTLVQGVHGPGTVHVIVVE